MIRGIGQPLLRQSLSFCLTVLENFSIVLLSLAGGWSNGKTADSDSAYRGSNPCPPAKVCCISGALSGPYRPDFLLRWSLSVVPIAILTRGFLVD